MRGNTRTRDYVVRRELDLGEGDAYNKVFVDRAERRLNNLGFFNKVRITNEPGSAPDRQNVTEQLKTYPFWMGEPGDIAAIALFLASNESRMITGAAIAADGGRSAY